ncbi:MAG: manganese efflux pump MntP [Bacilli bacterium]
MATALKMAALVLSLGVDTLLMSVSLGFVGTRGKWKVAFAFASVEALMPLVGLFSGLEAGRLIGRWASLIGGIALLCVAAWLIFFDDDGNGKQCDDGNDVTGAEASGNRSGVKEGRVVADSGTSAHPEPGDGAARQKRRFSRIGGGAARRKRRLVGWTLILTALSVSLDELAVGFSVGLIGVPIVLTIILIALQSFLFTVIGLAFGAKLRPYLGEWAEKLTGMVLLLLGLWIGIEAVVALIHGHHP